MLWEADGLLAHGSREDEIERFYSKNGWTTLSDGIARLRASSLFIQKEITKLTEEALLIKTKSYWGVERTLYSWLLEMIIHYSHHRGQLHGLLLSKQKQLGSFSFFL